MFIMERSFNSEKELNRKMSLTYGRRLNSVQELETDTFSKNDYLDKDAKRIPLKRPLDNSNYEEMKRSTPRNSGKSEMTNHWQELKQNLRSNSNEKTFETHHVNARPSKNYHLNAIISGEPDYTNLRSPKDFYVNGRSLENHHINEDTTNKFKRDSYYLDNHSKSRPNYFNQDSVIFRNYLNRDSGGSEIFSDNYNRDKRSRKIFSTYQKSDNQTFLNNHSRGKTNQLFLKHFDSYLADIERATKISIPENQRRLLLEHARNHPIEPLSSEAKNNARKKYNHLKEKLREDWEKNTGRKWPRTKGDGEEYNGKLISNSPVNYQLHHIILISYGGPNEWWNMHPAQPIIHQQWIHGPNSESKKIFP